MSKSAETKYSQTTISIFVLGLVLTFICGVVFFLPQPVLAVPVIPATGTMPSTDTFLNLTQANYSVSEAAKFTFLQSLDETTAYFFNTALASVLNDIARQSATWIATGGAGQKPQFLTDPHYWAKTYDAQLGGLIQTALQRWLPFNICDFDPKLAINLTLSNPFTLPPESEGQVPGNPGKTCSWTELRDKWTAFFADPLKTFQFNLSQGSGSLGSRTTDLNTMVLDNSILGKWDQRFCNSSQPAPVTACDNKSFVSADYCPAVSPGGTQVLTTLYATPLTTQDIICTQEKEIQKFLGEYVKNINDLMEALRFDLDFAVNCKQTAAGISGQMKIWKLLQEKGLSETYSITSFDCSLNEFGEEQVAEVGRAYQQVIELFRGTENEGIKFNMSNLRKCAYGNYDKLATCPAISGAGTSSQWKTLVEQLGIKPWDDIDLAPIQLAYAEQFEKDFCAVASNQAAYCPPSPADTNSLDNIKTVQIPNYVEGRYKSIYYTQVKEKTDYVIKIIETMDSYYGEISREVAKNFAPSNWADAAAYDAGMAKEYFSDVKETQTLDYVTKTIANQGIGGYVSSLLQSGLDNGWVGQTETISGKRKSPPSLVENQAKESMTTTYKEQVKSYTKNVLADAWAIFQATLFDELTKNLLANLFSSKTQSQARNQANVVKKSATEVLPIKTLSPYEQEINTAEGFADYAQKTVEKYAAKIASGADLNLLLDFQMTTANTANPNLYNGVIDKNFVQAINQKMTIGEAMADGKLVANRKFSWDGELADNTYSLDNIKKLRKARVVPLGLELAIELIRDCKYRQGLGLGDFSDINFNGGNPDGFNDPLQPFKTQRLQNCIFRIPNSVETEQLAKDYNSQKLNQVIEANLDDVVNGFNQVGSGICGDFDFGESPFCNLVDPNWVLKIPPTRCGLKSDTPLWGEVIQSNESGQRYDYCPDFMSCLEEDGKGGCINDRYGYCVKEQNLWQFGSGYCPAAFTSCKNYTLVTSAGDLPVSYLKNTLSGNDICGPNNAGCLWYSSKYAGGFWNSDQRIYLNRYVASCDRTAAGCTAMSLYRDPANNLVPDSSFEYTKANSFPANWELYLKQDITAQASPTCAGTNYASCSNYNYALLPATTQTDVTINQLACLDNGGTWENICSDTTKVTEQECTDAGGVWGNRCSNASKIVDLADLAGEKTDCIAREGTFKQYCLTSILKYDLCSNPQFNDIEGGDSAQVQCEGHGGTWKTECQTEAGIIPELSASGMQADCQSVLNGGSWREYCQGALLYGSSRDQCLKLQGEWRGYGPFSDVAKVNSDAILTLDGANKLEIDISGLTADQQLQLMYRSQFQELNKSLTKAGDVYTATAYLRASHSLYQPITFSLSKTPPTELNSQNVVLYDNNIQASSTLVTTTSGTELDLTITLPGNEGAGSKIYLDAVDLYLNTVDQVTNNDFVRLSSNYDNNSKVYYKIPPQSLACRGYGPGDPPPVLKGLTNSTMCNGYWDESGIFTGIKNICYKYGPDNDACNDYTKVCEAEEVGCQLYNPQNNDPEVPGVIATTDFCPAECVGYNTYTQEPTLYDPKPEPLYNYFIPQTASACSVDQVGCTQFTNLDAATIGGETVQYFTYLKQCIKPNLGLGEKFFYSWPGLDRPLDPSQIIKYEFQADSNGAPKLFDDLTYTDDLQKDCRSSLGSADLYCVKFYDDNGIIYYRDIRRVISVSANCHPYLKSLQANASAERLIIEQKNCTITNGRWQAVGGQDGCVYDAIPNEGLQCQAANNGCRAYIGNRGNNVYVTLFDTFEDTDSLDWYSGETGLTTSGLTRSGESVAVGGHSMQVAAGVSIIHNYIDIEKGEVYTLSFWGKTSDPAGNVLEIKFSGAPADQAFATIVSQKVRLTSDWKNYIIGPVNITWDGLENNSLIFNGINGQINLDNILLRVVRDNVYVVKDSWVTPTSCDRNIYGRIEPQNPHPMLGCQAYADPYSRIYNLKSFSSLCRNSVVGCELLFDTKNSQNPNSQKYNEDTESSLDDVQIPADNLISVVLDSNFTCSPAVKSCQRLGVALNANTAQQSFADIYLLNDPDKYINVPNAILCNDPAYGCSELVNDQGISEYYKIEPNKLCAYSKGEANTGRPEGWYKKNSNFSLGCGSFDISENLKLSEADCQLKGGRISTNYNQCVAVLSGVSKVEDCTRVKGEWLAGEKICLAWPFSIYKTYEANKFQGYIGECDSAFSGCNAFTDINPNFIFNSNFESVGENNSVSAWQSRFTSSGGRLFETASARAGNQSIRLIKRTAADCPETATAPGCTAQPYALNQQISRLEKGKTYKISFYYRMPSDSSGRGETCEKPQAAMTFNPLGYCLNSTYQTETACSTGGSSWVALPKEQLYVFEPESSWKKVEAYYTVPSGRCGDEIHTNQAECNAANQTWTEYNFLLDYDLSLYAPLNGYCLVGNKKVYQDSSLNWILNQSACTSLGGTWQGNCPESYVLYDLVEVKEDSEDNYSVIDDDVNINRSSCNGVVNWDNGCVQFLNNNYDSFEILKVQRDRKCEQWAVCDSNCSDPQYKIKEDCENNQKIWDTNICTATNLCQGSASDVCTTYAPKKDNVRYDLAEQPLELKRITDSALHQGYIYRFGTAALDRLTQWRGGDYSGYSIPYRYPLEQELNFDSVEKFATYDQINDLDNKVDKDKRYLLPICKVFPAQDSPFPAEMAKVPKYKNLLNLFSQSYEVTELGNLCSYERADFSGMTVYLPILDSQKVKRVCSSPVSKRGLDCTYGGEEVCKIPGMKNSDVNRCEDIEDIKQFYGMENMCLEFDRLNPLYGDIYKNIYNTGIYQPYACLTSYPFGSDLCPMHNSPSTCQTNVFCLWDTDNDKCILNFARLKPVLSEVTGVANEIADDSPNYIFFSTEDGRLSLDGKCCTDQTRAVAGNNTIALGEKVDQGDNTYTCQPMSLGSYDDCRVKVTDVTGQISDPLQISPFEVVMLSEVSPVPAVLSVDYANYVFASMISGPITYPGDCSSPTLTANSGINTIEFKNLTADFHNNCVILITDNSGSVPVDYTLLVSPFTVGAIEEVTPVFTPSTNQTPSYTFKSHVMGTIAYEGDCTNSSVKTVTAEMVGNDITLAFNKMSFGVHSNCKIKVTSASTPPVTLTLAVTSFEIKDIMEIQGMPNPAYQPTSVYVYKFRSALPGTISVVGPCFASTSIVIKLDGINQNYSLDFKNLDPGTYGPTQDAAHKCQVKVTDPSAVVHTLDVSAFQVFTAPALGV